MVVIVSQAICLISNVQFNFHCFASVGMGDIGTN